MIPSQTTTMEKFYQDVIQDFGNRLFNKYNQKEQSFDSQMIDQIKIRLTSKMKNTKQLFRRALQIKHPNTSSRQDEQTRLLLSQVKKQQVQDNDDEIDYANIFHVQPVVAQVKKQQNDELGPIKHEPIQDQDQQRNGQEQLQRKQKLDDLKRHLTVHIVGTYERAAKKHTAKDQSTKLELQNVFIKVRDKNDQIFLSKLICDFKEAE